MLLEDSAAIVGLLLATLGLVLRQVTGSDVWDGIAALSIAALLIVAAFELARTNMGLLIGKQANPALVADIEAARSPPSATFSRWSRSARCWSGRAGCWSARGWTFGDELSATEAEAACVRLHDVLAERFDDIDDVFIEPVPSGDAELRAEARQRSEAAD